MNKKHILILLILLFTGAGIYLNYQLYILPQEITTEAYMAATKVSKEEKKLTNKLYDPKFRLTHAPIGTINTYIPTYNELDSDEAKYYFNAFDMSDTPVRETDDFYYTENDQAYLYVYQYENHIHYRSKSTMYDKPEGNISDEEAIKIAEDFVEDHYLFLDYDDIEVYREEGLLEIRFIDKIDSLKDYAFMTKVIMDGSGNVLVMDYNHMNFEKIGDCKIKSMEEAYYELPLDFDQDMTIYLDKCELVYIYENSIIQPAYLFQGAYGDKTFQSFIKAGIYQY